MTFATRLGTGSQVRSGSQCNLTVHVPADYNDVVVVYVSYSR